MDCYICGEPVRGDLKTHLRQHSEEIRARLRNPADAGIEWIRKQGVDPHSVMSTMDYIEVALPDGTEVCVDPEGDEVRDGVLMATAAACPYCSKSVSMSSGELGFHRSPGGVCEGSGRSVARVEMGRAVLVMDARGALRECGICGKNIRVDQNGNFKQHEGRYGGPCLGSGKYAGQ